MISYLVAAPQKLQKGKGALGGSEVCQSYPNQTVASGAMEVHWLLGSKDLHAWCDFPLTCSICSGLSCENLTRVEMSVRVKRTQSIMEPPWSLRLVSSLLRRSWFWLQGQKMLCGFLEFASYLWRLISFTWWQTMKMTEKNYFVPDDCNSFKSFKFFNWPQYLNFTLTFRGSCSVLTTVQSFS